MGIKHRLLVLDADNLVGDAQPIYSFSYAPSATCTTPRRMKFEVLLVAQDADELDLASQPSLHDSWHLHCGRRITGTEEIVGLGMGAEIADRLLR